MSIDWRDKFSTYAIRSQVLVWSSKLGSASSRRAKMSSTWSEEDIYFSQEKGLEADLLTERLGHETIRSRRGG